MINDYEKAQAAIERDAVKHDHATRRAMKEIAKWVNGVDLKTKTDSGYIDGVYFQIPVRIDGELQKYASINITFDINNNPFITSSIEDVPEEVKLRAG